MRLMPRISQLPHALYRADQVRALDAEAIRRGIPGERLMEAAGMASSLLLLAHWPDARNICVLVGTGNNGGDGFVLARLAMEVGLSVQVLQLGDRGSLGGDARLNADRYVDLGGDWADFEDVGLPQRIDVIVDAMLGTGLERDVQGSWARAIQSANSHSAPVLSLDIPSGLNADTGMVMGDAVQADVTISFIGLKQGLFTGEGPACVGEVVFDALDVPAAIYSSQILSARRMDWQKVASILSPKSRTAHKGHFGHVLVIGGNLGLAGAARLAAEAAARTGAGLITVATRPEHVAGLLAARPEVMSHGITSPDQLAPLMRQASVIAIGPGLGQDDWARSLWEEVRSYQGCPLVVDADALNLLAQDTSNKERHDDWVLTPHPGEAARLLGQSVQQIQQDRFAAVNNLSQRFGGVAVLKGAGSLIASGWRRPTAVCSDGNPGMASGGMGDLLTGIIAGLLASHDHEDHEDHGLDLEEAATLGVCLHAAAADLAAADQGEIGLLASDLLRYLPRLLNASI